MKNILKSKIFYILLFFFCFLIISNTNVFANAEIVVSDEKYTLSDEQNSYEYKIIFNSYNRYTTSNGYDWCSYGSYLLVSNSRIYISSDEIKSDSNITGDTTYHRYKFISDSPIFIYCRAGGTSYNDYINEKRPLSFDFSTLSTIKIYSISYYVNNSNYSNFDVTDVNDNVVFQSAPQEVEQTTIIQPLITSINFSQVLMEVLAILPIVLVVVIGVLSLRKAIQLLLQVLHNS